MKNLMFSMVIASLLPNVSLGQLSHDEPVRKNDRLASVVKIEDEHGSPVNHKLTPTLEPAFSQGFTTWEGYDRPDVTYRIQIIRNNSVVKTFATSKNYYQFNLATWKNHKFRVKAVDQNSGEEFAIGPIDEIITVPPDHIAKKSECTKICNGPDYAWKMSIWQDDVPNWSITDPAFLAVTRVFESWDPSTGAYNPLWQAMPPAQFFTSSQHYIDHNYQYYSVVLPNVIAASDPHYYDASGNLMSGLTYFVEKKMEQFEWADHNRTNTFTPNSSICDGALSWFSSGGWVNLFNSMPHPDNNTPDYSLGDEDLYCPSGSDWSGPWSSVPEGDADNGNGYKPEPIMYHCYIDGVGWFVSPTPCDDSGFIIYVGETQSNLNDAYSHMSQLLQLSSSDIDHIELNPLSNKNKGKKIMLGGNVDSGVRSFEDGLYRLIVVMKNGRGVPQYVAFETVEENPQ